MNITGKKFIASYSGGKDSALALYRAIQNGMIPCGLITTYNTSLNRSWFHGIPKELLHAVSEAVGIPLILIPTDGSDYRDLFVKELQKQKEQGVEVCVFGDIDIEEYLQWDTDLCRDAGLDAYFPLRNEKRADLVRKSVETGFRATINVVNTTMLSDKHLGMILSEEVINSIEAEGADPCGENGDYHTFVSDGPIFSHPVSFSKGEPLKRGNYTVIPLLP